MGLARAAAPAIASASGGQGGGCVGRHPAYVERVFEPSYAAGCSGHDEPELNPLSNLPGSGQDVTWTIKLPANGANFGVAAVGPTFWFGGPADDPHSLFGQAFEELQFYPNGVASNCTPNGGSCSASRRATTRSAHRCGRSRPPARSPTTTSRPRSTRC